MTSRIALAIRDAERAIIEGREKEVPFESVYGLTGAVLVAAAIERNTEAINKNTEALRALRPHHLGPG